MVIAAIFWILDNGAKWKDLPDRFGSRSAVHAYFRRWTRAGVFENICAMRVTSWKSATACVCTNASSPRRIIGDKAYDSDALAEDHDESLDDECIEMIAPHRSNRKRENKTQDGRVLRRYKRRWKVERTISWFQNFRRLCIRYEKSTMLFQGFLHLGCSMILLKEVYG